MVNDNVEQKELKQDVWDMRIRQTVTERVVFNEPLTEEEAEEAYLMGEFNDISDTRDHELVEILEMK